MKNLIELFGINKTYVRDSQVIYSLADITLSIKAGDSIGIVGRSGSGKSTLINIMCTLLSPTSGEYYFDGKKIACRTPASNDAIRLRQRCGYISQSSDMINNLSVIENVKLAAECRGVPIDDGTALEVLKHVGLSGHEYKYPTNLSGGERQRANIARALVCKPDVIFADEPTGSLDVVTSRHIVELMLELARSIHSTLVLVTHAPEYAALCGRQLGLEGGRLACDRRGVSAEEIADFIGRGS